MVLFSKFVLRLVGLDGVSEARSWRPLRLSIVATLLLLSIQAWTGDFVNVS